MEIALSLGSNLGDRQANIERASQLIARLPGTRIVARAPIYETDPVDVPPQFASCRFLNTALIIDRSGDLASFAAMLRSTEKSMGREETACRNAPRVIDIDIIYAGNEKVSEPGLTIPHPLWAQRRFVVAPLADVRPGTRVPGLKLTVRELLLTLPDEPKVAPYEGGR